MSRNAYLRQSVACVACPWTGTRKSAEGSCPKCGGKLRGSGRAARSFDMAMSGQTPKTPKRGRARVFGQDMLDGREGVELAGGPRRTTGSTADSRGKIKARRNAPRPPHPAASETLGQAFAGKQRRRPDEDLDPVTKRIRTGRKRRANAQPAGGGGGVWAEHNAKQSERAKRRKRQTNGHEVAGGLAIGSVSTPKELAGGLTTGPIAEFEGAGTMSGTSIFDPVLCELVYRWFCPPKGLILDPFAGGSVRGIVASHLGRRYVGIDLRPEQVAANEAQLRIAREPLPRWIVGDALNVRRLGEEFEGEVNLVFSCPPYGDLEVYSDDPADLSTMPDDKFDTAYEAVIVDACQLLAPNSFAVFVVGDYRDARGFYRGFVSKTIAAFELAGLRLYNEAILVTALGSLPVRARKQFEATRKLGKTHQNVLVFAKGDPKAATVAIGKVEYGDPEAFAGGQGAGDERQAPTAGPAAVNPPAPTQGPAIERIPATPLGGEV